MAKAKMPAKPEKGTLMEARVLASSQQQLNLTPFVGQSDPSVIWRNMISDSSQAFAYYRDLEEKDDQIAQCLETRRIGLLACPRQIVAASKEGEDEQRAEFIREVFAAIPNFAAALDHLLDAPGHGLAVLEIEYGYDGHQVYIEALHPRPPEWFLFNPATELQNGPLRLKANVWDYDGAEVPEYKFLIYSYRPRHGNRRGRPLLRRAFWPSWIKRQVLKFWLKYSEKGPGTIAVKYQAGAKAEAQANALSAAEEIATKTAVAFPEGFEIVEPLLRAARAIPTDVYRALVKEYCDTAIAKIILGQTLSSQGSEGGAGSRALGEVHQEVRIEKVQADAEDLMAVINDQLIHYLMAFNFGFDLPQPKWEVRVEESEDLNSRSLVDRRLQMMGLPLTEKYLRETYGVPTPEAEDVLVVGEQEKFAQMGIAAGGSVGGGAPPEEFTERDEREAGLDLAKLEREGKSRALTAYAALVQRAIAQVETKLERSET